MALSIRTLFASRGAASVGLTSASTPSWIHK